MLDAHLIITGSDIDFSQATVMAVLDTAKTQAQSLLYAHNGSWNSTALTNPRLNYFEVQTSEVGESGNFFKKDAASWASASEMRNNESSLIKLSSLVSKLKNNSFSFSVADCVNEDDDCGTISGFSNEFLNISASMRATIRLLEKDNIDIFSFDDKFELEKLVILLGDKYRETVDFPMSKNTTGTQTFLKSYFADHVVYNRRNHNPVSADLGNFSRTDFSHITATNKTVNVVSRRPFKAAGVYALPGQSVTITRTDSDTASASIFINSLRSASTDLMNENSGYNRPKFLRSQSIGLAAGESTTITSPYGGPIQIEFSDTGTSMTFEFSNVGQHPFWDESINTDADDAAFITKLNGGSYDWAEIATNNFTLHSTTDKMKTTLTDSRWNTPSKFVPFVTKYHHNYHKVLAGYQGDNIDNEAEIHTFATTKGFTIPVYDSVQHMNADQPSCGYGCSGNPYDAGWEFEILGHGDLHEVGHNFESGRFKFDGFEAHSTTNFYSYYVKSRANDEDAIAYSCQTIPFDTLLNDVKTTAPAALSFKQGVGLVIEMMMHAEEKGKLINGWHLIPRLHLLELAFKNTADADWDTAKTNLGFSGFTKNAVKNMTNNDWLLIAASYVTELDYRLFFDLFEIDYTTEAGAQVATFGFDPVEQAYYIPTDSSKYCDTLSGHTKTF
jgi:hypothetical protein